MTHQHHGAVKSQPHPKSVRHYRLTCDEWLQACTELKPAEMKVLYYLRTLDPWGDKNLDISVTDIADRLKCNKGTVSRALKALDTSGWIELEINSATVKLHTKNSTSNQVLSTDNGLSESNSVVLGSQVLSTDNGLSESNSVVLGSQVLPTDNLDDRQTTPMISRQHLASETASEHDVQIPLNYLKLSTPTKQSVCVGEGEKITIKDAAQSIDTSPFLLKATKKFQINLADPHLRRAIERWPERVEVAIACLQEKEATVKHPTRFLQKAIEEQWQPENLAKEKAPDDFQVWFKEARQRGLVVGSQRIDGKLMVYTVDERCVPFTQLRQQSWAALEAKLQAMTEELPLFAPSPPEQKQILVA